MLIDLNLDIVVHNSPKVVRGATVAFSPLTYGSVSDAWARGGYGAGALLATG